MSKTIIAVRHFGLGGRELLETAVTDINRRKVSILYLCGASAVPTPRKVKLISNIMRLFTNFMLKLFACFHFKDNWSQ